MFYHSYVVLYCCGYKWIIPFSLAGHQNKTFIIPKNVFMYRCTAHNYSIINKCKAHKITFSRYIDWEKSGMCIVIYSLGLIARHSITIFYIYLLDFSTFPTFLVSDFFSKHPIIISDWIPNKIIFTRPPWRRLPQAPKSRHAYFNIINWLRPWSGVLYFIDHCRPYLILPTMDGRIDTAFSFCFIDITMLVMQFIYVIFNFMNIFLKTKTKSIWNWMIFVNNT